jgi:hypothetical protein
MLRAFVALFVALVCIVPIRSVADSLQIDASRIKNAPIHYVQYSSLREFPAPVITWRRAGLASGIGEIEEIKARIIIPAIVESTRPVSAIVVEFQHADPGAIVVVIIWSDGDSREALISRNERDHYDPDAYKVLFAKPTP